MWRIERTWEENVTACSSVVPGVNLKLNLALTIVFTLLLACPQQDRCDGDGDCAANEACRQGACVPSQRDAGPDAGNGDSAVADRQNPDATAVDSSGGDASSTVLDAALPDHPHAGDAGSGDRGVGSDAGQLVSPTLCDPVEGARQVLLVPVSFAGETPSCTDLELTEHWFGATDSVAQYFSQISNGLLNIGGSISPSVSIPAPQACIGTSVAQNQQLLASLPIVIDEQLVNAGVTPDANASRVYVLPGAIKCETSGPSATALPPQNRLFLYGDSCRSSQLLAHEYGHILGLNHASSIAPSGAQRDVGDPSDVMGRGYFAPNGPHRAQLGWIPANRVTTVLASGTFHLAALGVDGREEPQLLVIPRADDPGLAIFVSFRLASGWDADLPADYAERSSIHSFTSVCPQPGVIPVAKTLLLGSVGDGEQLAADGTGITVRQQSHEANTAHVVVTVEN